MGRGSRWGHDGVTVGLRWGAGYERGALSVQPADCLHRVHATQWRLWQLRWVGGHGGVMVGSRWGGGFFGAQLDAPPRHKCAAL